MDSVRKTIVSNHSLERLSGTELSIYQLNKLATYSVHLTQLETDITTLIHDLVQPVDSVCNVIVSNNFDSRTDSEVALFS